jgi:bacillopeptidase F (M6 metalloprotease family)
MEPRRRKSAFSKAPRLADCCPRISMGGEVQQTITIPNTATKATLTFWYWPSTIDTITYDWQEAQVQNSSGATLAQIMKVASNTHVWTQVTYDLTTYKGQTIRVYFNDHQDGFGDLTYMYLDDVSVTVQ